jgi:hypothetical protein
VYPTPWTPHPHLTTQRRTGALAVLLEPGQEAPDQGLRAIPRVVDGKPAGQHVAAAPVPADGEARRAWWLEGVSHRSLVDPGAR